MKHLILLLLLFFPIITIAQKYDEKLLELLAINKLTAAEKRLKKLYGDDKSTIDYIFLNAKLNRKKGNYTFAKESFLKILQLDSMYANAYDELGVLESIRNDDFDASLRYLNKALELKPNSTNILTNRGAIYYVNDQFDLAIKDYKKVISIDPKEDYALYNLGLCYLSLELYEKAIEQFDKAQVLRKKDHKVYFDRGKSYFYLGRYREAKADFKKALKYSDTENRYEFIPKEDIEEYIQLCD